MARGNGTDDGSTEEDEAPPPPAAVNPLMAFLGAPDQPTAGAARATSAKDECNDELMRFVTYVDSNPLPLMNENGEFADPLSWWKTNEIRFPTLAKVARIYLAIPATSAPSERIFSKAKLVIDDLRSRLDPADASMMIFMKPNLKDHEKRMAKDEED